MLLFSFSSFYVIYVFTKYEIFFYGIWNIPLQTYEYFSFVRPVTDESLAISDSGIGQSVGALTQPGLGGKKVRQRDKSFLVAG